MRGQKRVEDARERAYDPRIHRLREKLFTKWMDCRVKPGNDSGSLVLLFHLQRQAHRLAGGGSALDGDRRFQIDARLLRRGMDRGRAGREMIEPGARLVAERTPELADRPIACGVAAEKGH